MSDSFETRSLKLSGDAPRIFLCTVLVALVVAICLFDSSSAKAQQGSIGPAGSSVNRSSDTGSGERILVLRTGRVMQGHIKTISTGWLVSTDRGNAVIPFEQVHFDADDLNEAYLRLRIQNGSPTVASHLRLAEWCLSQNILAEAARELRDALEKDSSNETARLMLDRVDTEIRRRAPVPQDVEQAQDVVLMTTEQAPEYEADEVRSLSGLSPETAREFVASIQPLLLNKCGNARCHGAAAENDFQLTRLRSGASNSRLISEKNLAVVLNDLRPGENGTARLLEVVRGSHAGQTIFNGRYGAGQMQTLQQWMKTASKELRFEMASTAKTVFSNRPQVPSQFPTADDELSDAASATSSEYTAGRFPESFTVANAEPAETVGHRDPSTGAQEGRVADPSEEMVASPTPLSNVQRLLQEARQHVRKQDAFDPEEFNRRFAGSRTR